METTQNTGVDAPASNPQNPPEKKYKLLNNNNLPNRKGRPRGTTSINSQASIKKLEELGFNPIEKLIEQYESIVTQLEEMDAGTRKNSAIARAQLETLKKGIADTLMRYAYKPIPTSTEQSVEHRTPLKITLEGIED